ncbi:MAG: hypothetical protein ACK4HQ_07130, partial [Brevinematales bacterium]
MKRIFFFYVCILLMFSLGCNMKEQTRSYLNEIIETFVPRLEEYKKEAMINLLSEFFQQIILAE